jgi:hypothetical protein
MSGTMTDVFSGDAFSSVTLTTLVNERYPYVPTFLRDLGLAPAQGMLTLDAAFEEATGSIRMLSAIPRGAPPSQAGHPKGTVRKLPSYHFSREVEINADELLGIRARGSMNPQTLQNLIIERVDGPVGLKTEWAMTLEHMLLGMIDGIVYDADNTTVLYDFFNFFGVSRPAALNLSFSTGGADTNAIGVGVMQMKRSMVQALNGMPTNGAQLVILAGDNYFDSLVGSKEYSTSKRNGAMGNQDAADRIVETTPYSAVVYGGALWVNYRGSDDGSMVAVPTNEARAFLRGVPGLFQTLYAPADTFETVSAIGLPLYLLNNPERQTSKRAVFELQSNPLVACLRPLSLRRLTKS